MHDTKGHNISEKNKTEGATTRRHMFSSRTGFPGLAVEKKGRKVVEFLVPRTVALDTKLPIEMNTSGIKGRLEQTSKWGGELVAALVDFTNKDENLRGTSR